MKHLIIDMSSLCWTSLLAGKDNENGYTVQHEGKEVRVNSAGFGYENAMASLAAAFKQTQTVPSQTILVVEGRNSKGLRKSMLEGYKDTRDSRPDAAYDEFNKLKEMLVDALLAVGASAVTQDGLEADDVIAYLAQNLDGDVVIMSRDGDLLQLVGFYAGSQRLSNALPNADSALRTVDLLRNGEINVNTYGPFPTRFVTLRKALVGKADEVPGAYKFGEKSFLDVCAVFGDQGLEALEKLIQQKRIPELADDVAELKCLQRIIDSEELVYQSYRAATLYPEKVNTLRMPLQWRVGMVKPLNPSTDERLKPYAGQARLVHAGNYEKAMEWATPLIKSSPVVALDIETSTPKESDEWLAAKLGVEVSDGSVDLGVDVFGSFLVGMSLTFGDNGQYTLYFTHKHAPEPSVHSLTNSQMQAVIGLIPKETFTVIQNVSFELSVLFQEFGKTWEDNGWHGFVPNVIDTKIMSSYVDENQKAGLKENSKRLLNYDQQTFESVTVISDEVHRLPKGGRTIKTWSEAGGDYAQVRYKMDELTANRVFHYGCDDTICTMALYNHFRTVMGIEKTWDTFMEVEQLPAYLTALAYVQGVPISMQRMGELKTEDDVKYDKAWSKIRQFLIDKGWEGTVCPEWVSEVDYGIWHSNAMIAHDQDAEEGEKFVPEDFPIRNIANPAHIKEAVLVYTGKTLDTKVRKIDRLAAAIETQFPEAAALAAAVASQDVATLNSLVKGRYSGEPVLDIDSAKKMQHLFYDVIGIPPRLINKATDTERQKKPALAAAVQKWNKILRGSEDLAMTPAETELLKKKAKTDAFALKWAVKFDATPEQAEILNAIQEMATVSTRRSLYYVPYKYVRHWKDGLVHANANQCAAVTRRYSFSGPNLQQLPKKGEGIKFREILLPHRKDAVIVSLDFSAQELRVCAELSQDANMLSCYTGNPDSDRDLHSLTASGAMLSEWGRGQLEAYRTEYGSDLAPGQDYELFMRLLNSEDKAVAKAAKDLRTKAKPVNFGALYGAQPPKLSQQLAIPLAESEAFLAARAKAFPDVIARDDKVAEKARSKGYAETMMGGRRHLAQVLTSTDSWEVERALRQCGNFEIQSSCAEMTKLAMARMWSRGLPSRYDCRFIAPIHDEVVWSVVKDQAYDFIAELHACMVAPYSTMKVPLASSISIGPNFGIQHELGEVPDRKIVEEAIANV